MSTPPPITRSRWSRRIIAVLIGLALFPLAEIALRLAGVAPDGMPVREIFRKPGPAFIRQGPVYRTANKYILDQTFPAEKPPDTTRIFIVGGSSAMGFPLETSASPAILLAAALDRIEPGRRHEVINAAGFAMDTRAVARVVTEIVNYQPDLIIVMTGHNEFLEQRYFPDDALQHLRLRRVIEVLISRSHNQPDHYLPHPVSDRERSLVEADFRRSLEQIVSTCEARKVKLGLATLPANIQDFRPYGLSAVLTLDEQRKLLAIAEKAVGPSDSLLLDADPLDDAGASFVRGTYDLHVAQAAYQSADAASDEGKKMEFENSAKNMIKTANEQFQAAADHDPYPVRVTSSLNNIIRDVAKSHKIVLADLDQTFASFRADLRHRDADFFFDHCHLNFEGEKIVVTDLIVAGFKTDVIPAVNFWDREADEAYAKLAPDNQALADAYYKIAYESGINMDRVHRGLDYANKALELDPNHAKAKLLRDRLEPIAKARYRLIGD